MKILEPKSGKINGIPMVCVRSFFNRTLTHRHILNRKWTMAAVTLFFVLALAVVFINSQAGFAVYYKGEQIGSARSMSDVTAIVTGAEEQLNDIFGREISLDGQISVTADIGTPADDTENITNAILGGTEGITEKYVLEVNGGAVGAADSQTALLGILSAILNEYTTEQSSSVHFTDSIVISHKFTSADLTMDPSEIRSLLDPKNNASPYALTVENTVEQSHTEQVAFDVSQVNDDTLYEGTKIVRTKGVPGEYQVTESTVYINGVQQATKIVDTAAVQNPVTEVVAVGTMPLPKTASYGTYIWPAEGQITSGFGKRTGFGSSNHQGIDIAGSYGQDIVAADGGLVVRSGWAGRYGYLVEIQHDNGDVTYYGHCSKLLVEEGERVYQGQIIALMGSTGDSSGVHCHFEVRIDGNPVNPIKHLP